MNLKKLKAFAVTAVGILSLLFVFTACSNDPVEIPDDDSDVVSINSDLIGKDDEEEVKEEEIDEDLLETKEGCVRSELTNEWIDKSLEKQRPIAVMVDNELTALDHYGVNQSDVVYELMNSTANGRITRLMCIIKDWEKIEQLGSIRSTRTTNVMLSFEWNAILVHDGGPFYIDGYIAMPQCNHLSGGFARYSNGKNSEFTEYVTYEDYKNPTTGKSYNGLKKRLDDAGFSLDYNKYYEGKHWEFSKGDNKIGEMKGAKNVKQIDLPFPHNKSQLKYDSENKVYEYYEYGKAHIDALDGETTSFKNVILECISFTQLDVNGYLTYNVTDSTSHEGYYVTNGSAVPITWSKATPEGITHYYYKSTGEEIKLNTGKTYIAFVPADSWDDLELK